MRGREWSGRGFMRRRWKVFEEAIDGIEQLEMIVLELFSEWIDRK